MGYKWRLSYALANSLGKASATCTTCGSWQAWARWPLARR